MSEQISQRELRNESGRIMRALDEGRSFVVTRNGRPLGELQPLRRDRFVDVGVALAAFERAPTIDGAALREDIDRLIDQAVEPRA